MLELTTKWMTNTLAKQSMLKNDYILCSNGTRLYIVGYGALTSSGKNTYNYEVKDNEKNIVLSSGENAYLDALTKIILGTSPKAKANKEESAKQSAKQSAKVSSNIVDEYKRLENNLKKAILAFNEFKQKEDIRNLQDAILAQKDTQALKRRVKQDARREEVAILKRIANLRKWAKETKRLDLLQSLNEKLLEM
jgi:hypothetical protein